MRRLVPVLAAVLVAAAALAAPAVAPADVHAMFDQAESDGRVGVARKTRPVDARPAEPGEVVVTVIAGEGKETESPPAQPGDMVVRNRCRATGNEEILVTAAKFAERYEGPIGPDDGAGWQPYRPRGIEMRYFVVAAADGTFTFTAPWGEPMVARRRDRPRSRGSGGHLPDRGGGVRLHLRDSAPGALSPVPHTELDL